MAPPSSVSVCIADEFGEMSGPAAVELGDMLSGVGAEAIQLTMLQRHYRAAALGRGESQLHLGDKIMIVGPLAVDLPAEQQARVSGDS